jgi:hypothetical protein
MGYKRFLIEKYRELLYFLNKLDRVQAFKTNSEFQFDKKILNINKGDIVHPCVRYSKNKFLGYNWWLIYTPYYNNNAKIENPVLCYGTDEGNGKPPLKWNYYMDVVDEQLFGYNSDPNMYFNDLGLNIFWRENNTPRVKKHNAYRATFGLTINSKGKINHYDKPLLVEKRRYYDKEVSPSFFEMDGQFYAYAMNLRFKNKYWIYNSSIINNISSKLLSLLSLLELKSHIKSYGVSIWKSGTLKDSFTYQKTIGFKNLNSLYNPWHLDTFIYQNVTYALIQSNKSNADICLAYKNQSDDFFMVYPKPLITCNGINKLGIYKPSGLVINGIFYLFYTAQELNNRKLNKLFFSEYVFKDLISNIS